MLAAKLRRVYWGATNEICRYISPYLEYVVNSKILTSLLWMHESAYVCLPGDKLQGVCVCTCKLNMSLETNFIVTAQHLRSHPYATSKVILAQCLLPFHCLSVPLPPARFCSSTFAMFLSSCGYTFLFQRQIQMWAIVSGEGFGKFYKGISSKRSIKKSSTIFLGLSKLGTFIR